MPPDRLVLCLLVAAFVLGAAPAAAGALPADLDRALRQAGIPAASVGLWVRPLDAERPALELNSGTPLNPASVIKLVTTWAALEALGPAYRWKTEAWEVGTRDGTTLTGHLFLKGGGDPKLTYEDFWLLLRGLRARGLHDLQGDLVLDRSYFETPEHDPARFDDEPLRPYNVGPDALLVSFKSVRFDFVPDPASRRVRLVVEPKPHPLEIVNVLRLSDGSCGDWRARLRPEFRRATPPRSAYHALFTGSFAAACGEKSWNVSLFAQRDYVAGVFRELWEELGGRWTGTAHDGVVPTDARLVAVRESPPLADIVRDINKFSNNVMAQQLVLTLGAHASRAPARRELSVRAVEAALARASIAMPGLVIENGAGLSRRARVTAAGLGNLLAAAFRGPTMPEFMASLPVVAVDGTLRKRMKRTPVAGQAHIKSGTLSGVRAIGGYVLDKAGRRVAVAMMVNDANAARWRPAMEALLTWVYEGAKDE